MADSDRSSSMWVGANSGAVIEEAARRFMDAAMRSIQARGRFRVVLTGGNTPRPLYERLGQPPLRDRIEWPRVEIFFGDERAVPSDHPDSNYGMTKRALLDHVPIDALRVHRMAGEEARGGERYDALLRTLFPAAERVDGFPVFDLLLLGVGADGHTASLFPYTEALSEMTRWATDNWVEKLHSWRVTLTWPVLNRARETLILACGKEKGPVVQIFYTPPGDPQKHPIVALRPPHLTWLVDTAAASPL